MAPPQLNRHAARLVASRGAGRVAQSIIDINPSGAEPGEGSDRPAAGRAGRGGAGLGLRRALAARGARKARRGQEQAGHVLRRRGS